MSRLFDLGSTFAIAFWQAFASSGLALELATSGRPSAWAWVASIGGSAVVGLNAVRKALQLPPVDPPSVRIPTSLSVKEAPTK